MRKIVAIAALALAALFTNETFAAAQTSKFGIPSSSGSGAVQLPVSTVAQLPSCDVSHAGLIRVVTDATTPSYNGALTGGGAVVVTVLCNGTAWKSQ